MDLTQFKEALGEKYTALEEYVTALVSQRDEARRESVDGRKKLKADLEALKAFREKAYDKLGLESDDDLEALQGKPAAAEMERQYQTKIKRLEADLKDRDTKLADTEGRYRKERANAAIVAAIGKHQFIDSDVAKLLIGSRVEFEGDDIFYKTDEGRLIPVEEGAAMVATTKPHLLRAQGAGGSGTPPAGTAGAVKNPWSKDHFNLTEQGKLLTSNPQLAKQMQEAAGK